MAARRRRKAELIVVSTREYGEEPLTLTLFNNSSSRPHKHLPHATRVRTWSCFHHQDHQDVPIWPLAKGGWSGIRVTETTTERDKVRQGFLFVLHRVS